MIPRVLRTAEGSSIMLRSNLFKMVWVLFLIVLFVMSARRMIKWQADLSSPKRDTSCLNQNTPRKPGDECPQQPTALHAKCQRTLHGIELSKGLVLGQPRNAKVFLSVGLIYSAGEETAVRAALTSIFKHMTPQEHNDIIVVVVVSNSNQLEFLKDIQNEFDEFLRLGVLQVISPTEKFYRAVYWGNIEWKGYSNAFKRSMTAFNMRLVYLMEHCRHVSRFYLQMSSFCRVPMSFLPVIKETVAASIGNASYAYGTFYRRGILSLGGLFSQNMVRELAAFGAMFPSTGLPYLILDYYWPLRSFIKQIPSKDVFGFMKVLQGQKPSAQFYTNLRAGAPELQLQDAYSKATGYYWAIRPIAGQHFVMTFEEPVRLSRVRITSGTPFYKDILTDGVVKACDASGASSRCEDSQCVDLGKVKDTVVDAGELERTLLFPVKCLKMVITKDHDFWVIIRDISLWTRQ